MLASDIAYDPWGGMRQANPLAAANYLQGAAGGGVQTASTTAINAPTTAGSGFGFNMDTANLALGGLQTIAGIWNAFQQNKLAKKQFEFQKDITETNLANQIKSYNTTLADRGRSRAFTEGQSAEEAQRYITDNSLSRRPQ